ncbi:MAG: DUF167 domain-containing protein [Proteobacteria bacterium]|nr:DUF167 domain-containing protein [Pseudomonadota bacterium]
MLDMKDEKEGVSFQVFVLPKSSRNMVSGLHNGAMKLKLTAPPVDNAANKLCIAYLSKCLKVSKSSIEILSGHTGRNKQLFVKCPGRSDAATEKAAIRNKLQELLSEKT